MKRLIIFALLLLLILTGCKPSPEAIQQAIYETQTAMPTQTNTPAPTPIPLRDIDLSTVIFQEGDLPAGYEPSQIRSQVGDLSNAAPTPDNFFSQSLEKSGNFGGIVDILIYEDESTIQQAYLLVSSEMPGDEEEVDIGDSGMIATNILFVNTVSVTFIRCHAVVSFQFQGTISEDSAISYATRLDKRLQPLVCR